MRKGKANTSTRGNGERGTGNGLLRFPPFPVPCSLFPYSTTRRAPIHRFHHQRP
jgi:hypothetical protein